MIGKGVGPDTPLGLRDVLKIDVDVARAVPIAVDRAFARRAAKYTLFPCNMRCISPQRPHVQDVSSSVASHNRHLPRRFASDPPPFPAASSATSHRVAHRHARRGNEAGGDGSFDAGEAVHAMGPGVDAADRSGGGGDATGLAQRCGRDVYGALHGQ
eukprot:ANDGO_02222.mRNA.1 hypothetical protein